MNDSTTRPERAAKPIVVDLLGGGDTMARHLTEALEAQGGRLRRFERAETWLETVRSEVPDAVMVPAPLAGSIAELLGKLSLTGVPAGSVLLIAFGRPKERLDALIGGADWFIERSTDPLIGQVVTDWLLQQDREPYRVLVIDDDRDTRLLCGSILRKVGMQVEELGQTAGALDAIRRFRPDLVLLDLYMPDQDGISLVQSLRESELTPLLPIVFLSAEERPSARSAALHVGADDFLCKPVRPQPLIAAVRTRIKRARSLNRRLRAGPGAERGRLRRSEFLEVLARRVRHPAGEWQTLAALRIDEADTIRETLGLAATLELERMVAARIEARLGPQDCLALWEELGFGWLLCRDRREEVQQAIEGLLEAIAAEPFVVGDRSLALRASIGYALHPSDPRAGREAWLQQAFAALAMARRLGGGRSEGLLSRDPSALPPERIMVIQRVLKDLPRGSLPRFDFQPMLQLRGEQGHYALICKLPDPRNPLEGFPRSQYLGLAREEGVSGLIDRMALFHALETLADRRQQGRPVRVLVPVDLSAFDERQLAWLRAERQRRPDAVTDLHLEVDIEALRAGGSESLRELGALGIQIAVSDPSGSLLALQELLTTPVDLLRLPHASLQQAPEARLAELIAPWRQSGRRLLVDGVEDLKAVTGLWNLGIDYLQGDALAPPQPRIEDERER